MIDPNLGLLLTKPIATGGVAYGLTQYMQRSLGMRHSAAVGVAAGVGVLAADVISKQMNKTQGVVTRSLEERAMEIGFSVGGAMLTQRYILNEDLYYPQQTAAIVIASDIVGEYIAATFF